MKKIIFTLLLSLTYIGLYAQCTGLGTGTNKAKTMKSCYDTVTVASYLNTLTADTCNFTKITISGTGSNLLKTTNNLSDVSSISTSRTNLGLGTIVTKDSATAAEISSVYKSYNIACWGNSLTFADPGYPSKLATLIGTTVFNGGRGGDTSTQIKVRMLNDTSKYSYSTIICVGRNNFANPSQVLADIAAMVAALGHTRYLVLSVPNGTAEPNPSSGYTQIMALNASLASTYGARYVDFRSYLVSLYNPGIPQDVIDHANDVPPSSLRTDALHYTTNGYYYIAYYIYNNYLNILQPQVYKPINLNDVAKILHNNSGANFKNFLTVTGGGDTSLINNELLTNGTFTGSLSGWTAGANWSSSSNTALHGSGSNATLTQAITTVGSSVYLFQVTVSGYSAGTLTASLGSSLGSIVMSANGTYYYSFYPSTTGSVTLTFQPTSSFVGAIDNVSVKLITPYGSPVVKISSPKDSLSPIEIRASQIGYYNWFFGGGRRNYNGTFNVGFGANSLGYNTTGSANTGYGYNSVALNVNGSSNTGIGSNSMAVAVASSFCSSVGANNMLALTSGTDNTSVGYNGLLVNTTGSYNCTFGSRTGNNISTGTFNQIYGAYCTAPSASGTGQLNIGNVLYGINLYQTAAASSTPTATGAIGVGVTTPTSTFQVNGSVGLSYVAKTTTYSIAATDYVIDCTSGTFTVTLPTAASITGRMYIIKNSGAGTITVATTSSQTIDGVTTKTLSVQYGGLAVQSNGANWIVTQLF